MKRYFLLGLLLICVLINSAQAAKHELKFRKDGTFKIVQFSDIHTDENLNPKTTALMEQILDAEKPDFVVLAGDTIWGVDCENADCVKKAIASVAFPMEKRNIPWAICFGNHDQEHFKNTNMDKAAVLNEYAKNPHNLNDKWAKGISGAGNNDLLIRGSSSNKPVFALWLLDSGMYGPSKVSGYDWIHRDQIDWYRRTSMDLEFRCGAKIPGIMFFHIPIPEFAQMVEKTKVFGDAFEGVADADVNGGLFAAVLERGDVKGIFVGHDHNNNYVGEWMGIRLGFDSSAGLDAYGLPDDNPNKDRVKGGRVFEIKESAPWSYNTWMRFRDGTTNLAESQK